MIIAMRESTTRLRRASWTHTGTHYLSSDGSYADAATSAAARVCFSGTGAPTFTFAAWITPTAYTSGQHAMQVSDDGAPSAALRVNTAAGFVGALANAAGTSDSVTGDQSGAVHVALVCNGSTAVLYENGVSKGSVSLPATPYASVDAFTLFADYAHANRMAGDIRSPAIWDRALSGDEVVSLALDASPGHDLREQYVDYLGSGQAGPVHWWPADGDSGTTVTDRGSVGGCNLTLHGGVTIKEV